MRNRKKIIIAALVLLILIFLAVLCDNTRGAKIELGGSKLYSEDEIRAAANIVLRKFRSFPAKLERLWYDEARSLNEQDFALQYGADEALVLLSDFRTYGGRLAMGSGFEPDMLYKNWMWVLVRSEGKNWRLVTWGY